MPTFNAPVRPFPMPDDAARPDLLNKVAAVTLAFWVLKILATTLGETAGDYLSMTLGLGYGVGLAVTGAVLVAVLAVQIAATRYHAALFWTAIVATTTAGTEVSNMMDRTLGLGRGLHAPRGRPRRDALGVVAPHR